MRLVKALLLQAAALSCSVLLSTPASAESALRGHADKVASVPAIDNLGKGPRKASVGRVKAPNSNLTLSRIAYGGLHFPEFKGECHSQYSSDRPD
jgi:hypothetical protein